MPRTAAGWVACVGLTLGLAACQTPPLNQNAAALTALRPAATCAATLPWFGRYPTGNWRVPDIYEPPDGRMTMANDGGWCTAAFTYSMYAGRLPIVAPLRVARPPAHGEAVVGSVGPSMRIAYRPAPGFAGTDAFTVSMAGPEPWTIPVHVLVIR